MKGLTHLPMNQAFVKAVRNGTETNVLAASPDAIVEQDRDVAGFDRPVRHRHVGPSPL